MPTHGPRYRALLTGTGWTLAVIATLAWFKSAPLAPITLMSLGALALGWAGVWMCAMKSEQRAARAVIGEESRMVIDELARVIGMEMQRAHIELGRVDDLLAHAIEQLMNAFNSVSEEARRHQTELAQLASAARGTPAGEQLRAAAERVTSEVNGAVTALQFRDVVGQKLGHVRRELDALEQAMQQIRAVAGAQGGPATPGRQDLATQVHGLLRNLEMARAASPVRQEFMHAGEVDLF